MYGSYLVWCPVEDLCSRRQQKLSKSVEECCRSLRWHQTLLFICCRRSGADNHVLQLGSLRLT